MSSEETSNPILTGLTEKLATIDWVGWGIKVIFAIAVLFVGKFLVGIATKLIKKGLTQAGRAPILVNFAGSVARMFLFLFVIIFALNLVGIPTSSFVALIGAAGLAIGLALQDSLKNFASGFLLVLFRPFKVGDYVEAGGTEGIVEQINIFSTTMRTLDNKEVIVPNGSIYDDNITNYSKRERRRVDMVFGIGYEDDLRKAKELLLQWANEDERVLDDPACLVGVCELADSSVNLTVRPWVKTEDAFTFKLDYIEKVKLGFDEAGISIPYPQMDVHSKVQGNT